MPSKDYLGDSVYVETDPVDPGGIILTTENGLPDDPSNTIVLEQQVIDALIHYLERVK